MQIQENIEYDVKALLQTVLDTMKTLRQWLKRFEDLNPAIVNEVKL